MTHQILQGDCSQVLPSDQIDKTVDLTFLDPPFNQSKDYVHHDDSLPDEDYWQWMHQICKAIFDVTSDGGAIYFMQREKNSEEVLRCLRETGWTFQNLIIWKKLTSAVPSATRFGKHYQVIAFATKGKKPRLFNKLRISPPLPANYKYERPNGMYVTDVWDDIRELTSGYFAGDEALRNEDGERFHKQQAPIALLLRIILSSSLAEDVVLDPFAGTGTTLVVAHQLNRKAIGVEIDPQNVESIRQRLENGRSADDVRKYYQDYTHTEGIETIWGAPLTQPTTIRTEESDVLDLPLFRSSDT